MICTKIDCEFCVKFKGENVSISCICIYKHMQIITQPYEIPLSVSSPVSKAVEHTFQERNCMEDEK